MLITVEKNTKTDNLRDFPLYLFHQGTNYNAYEFMGAHFIEENGKDIILNLNLASGNTNTLNPQLLLSVFANQFSVSVDGALICRKSILDEKGEIFA